jgi:hypothetical protein
MAANEETNGRRVALPTAIAGLVGTLAGTVVGGLISLTAVEASIRAEEASSLRANRQEAYSVFVADATQLVQLMRRDLDDDQQIDPVELTELEKYNLGVTRSYNVAFFIASDAVSDTLSELDNAVEEFGEAALNGDAGDIEDTRKKLNKAFDAFRNTAREDLGSTG